MLQAIYTKLPQLGAHQFGAHQLGETYKCGSTASGGYICWSLDNATEELFASLQRQVNRFAAKAGFTPLIIDTQIGKDTVAALIKAIDHAAVTGVLPVWSQPAFAVIAELKGEAQIAAVAQWAYELQSVLSDSAGDLNLPPGTGEIVRPSRSTGTTTPTSVTKVRPPKPSEGSSTIWWVIGILAAGGIGTVGYLTYKRSRLLRQSPA